jgi:hypothetical protein
MGGSPCEFLLARASAGILADLLEETSPEDSVGIRIVLGSRDEASPNILDHQALFAVTNEPICLGDGIGVADEDLTLFVPEDDLEEIWFHEFLLVNPSGASLAFETVERERVVE